MDSWKGSPEASFSGLAVYKMVPVSRLSKRTCHERLAQSPVHEARIPQCLGPVSLQPTQPGPTVASLTSSACCTLQPGQASILPQLVSAGEQSPLDATALHLVGDESPGPRFHHCR